MIGTFSKDLEESKEFNCSAFLGHGLRWPVNEYPIEQEDCVNGSHLVQDNFYGEHLGQQMQTDVQEQFLEEQYYPEEYNSLLQYMDTVEGPITAPLPTGDKREQILKISMVADQALDREIFPFAHPVSFEFDQYPSPACKDLAMEVAAKALEAENPMMSPEGFQSLVEEHLVGFGEVIKQPRDSCRKRRLCRHFVKGFCMRGVNCDFLHDPSIFCSDTQKIFLGGLPLNLTPATLKEKLEEQGLTVLNKPRILRGFTPQVCLGTVEEAEMLITQRYIYIDDHRVDVRPYQDRDQLRQVLPRVVKRSVFLGGLPENTTGNMIIKDLQRLDVKVVEYPVVKNGYAPRVVLGSLEHAKMLVDLKRVMVNGTVVDVRPYVNFRKRY